MFKKKKCKKCGSKISESNSFCPSCGVKLNENDTDWGMLGKNDAPENELDMLSKTLFNSLNSGFLNKMIGSAMKMIEKEMKKVDNNPQFKKNNFQLYINGKRINPENIKLTQSPAKPEGSIKKNLSKEKLKKFAILPKQEPLSNMKRFSDEVVYEIDIPGVESINDIIISKLESSIEIKALAKDKVYSKIIPVNLPIKKYNLQDDKLFLQLSTE